MLADRLTRLQQCAWAVFLSLLVPPTLLSYTPHHLPRPLRHASPSKNNQFPKVSKPNTHRLLCPIKKNHLPLHFKTSTVVLRFSPVIFSAHFQGEKARESLAICICLLYYYCTVVSCHWLSHVFGYLSLCIVPF